LFAAAGAAELVPSPVSHRAAMLPWSLEQRSRGSQAETWDSLWWDGVAQFHPWRWILADALRQGELPLWSPWSFCGQPFAANGQSACFYPPALLLCGLLPAGRALGLLWLFHLALAVFLTWGLARRMGASHIGGLAAGVVYAGGGFLLAWAPVPSLLQSAAWLPGALWAVEAALHRRPWEGATGIALCLGMAVLAGHMQVAGYVGLTTAGWAAARLLGRALRRKPWPVLPVAAGFALALGLAAVQGLPTVELGRLSPRGGEAPTAAGYKFAQILALKPIHLLTFLWPTVLGSPARGDALDPAFAEHFCGLGPVTCFLVLVAFAGKRDRHIYGMTVLALVALLVALATPLAALVYYGVPFLGLTAGFQRTLFVFCLAVAVLAGRGVMNLCEWPARGGKPHWGGAVGAIVLLGLMAQGVWMTGSLLPLARAAELDRPVKEAQWLTAETGQRARVLALTPRAAWTLRPRPEAVMPPNTAAPMGLQDVQGYDSLYPRTYRDTAAAIEGSDPAPLTNGNMVLLERADAPELAELGVRYVLSAGPVRSPLLQKVREIGSLSPFAAGSTLYIYERRDWEPRWRVRRGEVTHEVQATQAGYNSLRLLAVPGDGTVEVADTPFPGWRVYVDGQPQAWAPKPGLPLVRTVVLSDPARPHRVDFVFWPVTLVVGGFASLAAFGLTVAVAVAGRRRS